MKSRITATVKLDSRLKSFVLSVYGKEPVYFPKRDKLNSLLSVLLSKPPLDFKFTTLDPVNDLVIILPYFEHLNINSHNYLSDRSQRVFAKRIKTLFDVAFVDFIDKCFLDGIDRVDAVNLFIDKYNLPDDLSHQETLLKAIYRSKKIMSRYPKRKYVKSS